LMRGRRRGGWNGIGSEVGSLMGGRPDGAAEATTGGGGTWPGGGRDYHRLRP
jgi:hypothetical protein